MDIIMFLNSCLKSVRSLSTIKKCSYNLWYCFLQLGTKTQVIDFKLLLIQVHICSNYLPSNFSASEKARSFNVSLTRRAQNRLLDVKGYSLVVLVLEDEFWNSRGKSSPEVVLLTYSVGRAPLDVSWGLGK